MRGHNKFARKLNFMINTMNENKIKTQVIFSESSFFLLN